MVTVDPVTSEPWGSVKSRVSWGALLAGAAVGVATYTVLAMLGVAVGLSVADNTSAENLGLGAGIWAFVSLLIAMFFAGWVTTQCTVGETRTEAVLYGIIVWAVTATFLVWSAAMGFGIGKAAASSRTSGSSPAASGLTGVPGVSGANATSSSGGGDQNSNQNNQNSQDRDRLQRASWWTFFGTVLSLAAAIGGAMLGPYEFVPRQSTQGRVRVSASGV